jgi:hypothetical protein
MVKFNRSISELSIATKYYQCEQYDQLQHDMRFEF